MNVSMSLPETAITSQRFVIAGPSSKGGLLVQNVHNNQAVQVNLTELPSSKVTVNDCHNCQIHFYGSCGDLLLV